MQALHRAKLDQPRATIKLMPDYLAEAHALHAENIVVDGHADTPQRFADEAWQWTDPELRGGQLSAQTAKAGHLHAEFFALWAEPTQWQGHHQDRTLQLLAAVEDQLTRHPEALTLCTTSADVRAAKAQNKFAALLGVEGGHSIGTDLDLLRHLHTRGVRYMTLTWSNTNDWCDSSNDTAQHNGLTTFGCRVIAEMNNLGMLVDLSHVSDAAFWQAIRTSRAPVIASHSSARALTDAPRNLTDDQLRAIAESGGVVMVNFFTAFLSEPFRHAWNHQRGEREAAIDAARTAAHAANQPFHFSHELAIDRTFARQLPRPPLATLLAHIDHVLRICGPAHTGLGSDFDGIPLAPAGIDTAADLPRITAGLIARGWHPSGLRGLLGENILRTLDQAKV